MISSRQTDDESLRITVALTQFRRAHHTDPRTVTVDDDRRQFPRSRQLNGVGLVPVEELHVHSGT